LKTIVLLGGGGHCRSCIDVIEAEQKFSISGIIQPTSDSNVDVIGYSVLGNDNDLSFILAQHNTAFVTVGQIKSSEVRKRLYYQLRELGAEIPVIISPMARCAPSAFVEEGTILMHGSLVNANAHVGANCIINSQALIEHDAYVSDHCHVSTGARVNGGVHVGEGTFVGSGAILKEGIRIGRGVVIGAGQVVLKDIADGVLIIGKND
jgi:sugar O-acyltransferase (sialic acid O-acetyltransferase NeuD family)